jgi:1A family penicillin-binding protein
MWYRYRRRKPLYRRKWFLILIGTVLLIVLGAAGYSWLWFHQYQKRAEQFDLTKLQEMESASLIFDRNNAIFGRIFIHNRVPISLAELPYPLIQAVIAAEDNRFYQHRGVDYVGMARAALRNFQAKRIRQGASTITQQLARNTYSLREKTYKRKLVEVLLSRRIESQFSKNKILELYLNRIYFGSGFYGVEAAARGYFGKPARQLDLTESATLAGLLKSPNNYSPWSNRAASIEQRDRVLERMLELRMITREQRNQAVKQVLVVKNRQPVHDESYAVDLIRQQLVAKVGLDGATNDGYRIYTTIDPDLQRIGEETLHAKLTEIEQRKAYEHQTYEQYEALIRRASDEQPPTPDYLQGAIVVLDNATGGILTLIGGRDFKHSEFNRATSALRPAGTAFIPFVYAAAFDTAKLFPGTLVQDAVIDNRQVMIGGTTGILGEWGPERVDNRYEGDIPARYALVKSKNAAAVRVGMQAGLEKVIALAKKAGISSKLREFPATFLGSSEVSLMDLTLAYTIFPNGGWRPDKPYIISRVDDSEGNVVFQEKPATERVLKGPVAYEVHSCLSEVLEWGTADKAYSQYGLKKFALGGKTGTSYNFTDAWFLGYSSAITCGVWTGFDKPQPIYRGAFSNEITLPIWVQLMNASFASYQPKSIAPPRGVRKYEICLSSGLLSTDKCFETDENTGEKPAKRRTTYFEYAAPEQVPVNTCDVHGETVRSYVKTISEGEWPRAAPAVDLESITPVAMQAPTVVGDEDPYGAVKATGVLAAAQDSGAIAPIDNSATPPDANATGAEPDDGVEVRRAEQARPFDQQANDLPIQFEAPPPWSFDGGKYSRQNCGVGVATALWAVGGLGGPVGSGKCYPSYLFLIVILFLFLILHYRRHVPAAQSRLYTSSLLRSRCVILRSSESRPAPLLSPIPRAMQWPA